jgi:hypothetical protein
MHRAAPAYDELCGKYFRKAKMPVVEIQCIPIASDDGLSGWRCRGILVERQIYA